MKITNEEVDRIWKLSLDKRNWEKLGKEYKNFVKWLKHAEEIAIKITEQNGIKTILHIPRPEEGDRFSFISEFSSKNMCDEDKIRMIEKALDAVKIAYKEC